MNSLLQLLKISRPRFWLYLAGPFLVGYTFGMTNKAQFLDTSFILGLVYFLLPANLFLYGVNDLFDQDTDKFNSKKGTKEYKLTSISQIKNPLLLTILVSLLYMNFLTGIESLLLSLFLLMSYIYSAEPIRLKAKPILDSASNILYIIPGILGLYLSSGQLPDYSVIFALFCWTFAMHLFSAIPDIDADKSANLKTTAVVLGKRKSLLVTAAMWLIFTTIFIYQNILGIIFLVYPLIPIILIFKEDATLKKYYWYFPYINALFGFAVFLLSAYKMI